MSDQPRISDAEWAIMDVLWQQHPRTADEIIAIVAPPRDWGERTVKTMLGRLVKKGALRFEAEGRRYKYSPAVAREDCIRTESQNFLERCFGGQTGPALAHFVRQGSLSPDDIAELRRLLDAKDS